VIRYWLIIATLFAVAGCAAQTDIKQELAAIHHELRQAAGRDVITGLSSRGTTLIAVTLFVVCGICFVAYRWDRNRSNRIITEQAVRKVTGGDN